MSTLVKKMKSIVLLVMPLLANAPSTPAWSGSPLPGKESPCRLTTISALFAVGRMLHRVQWCALIILRHWCVVSRCPTSAWLYPQVLYRPEDHQIATVVTPRSTLLGGVPQVCQLCRRPFTTPGSREEPTAAPEPSSEHMRRPYVAPGYFLCLDGYNQV